MADRVSKCVTVILFIWGALIGFCFVQRWHGTTTNVLMCEHSALNNVITIAVHSIAMETWFAGTFIAANSVVAVSRLMAIVALILTLIHIWNVQEPEDKMSVMCRVMNVHLLISTIEFHYETSVKTLYVLLLASTVCPISNESWFIQQRWLPLLSLATLSPLMTEVISTLIIIIRDYCTGIRNYLLLSTRCALRQFVVCMV